MKKLLLLFTCAVACLAISAQDKKVAISSAVASCAEGSNPAELAIDGNPKTYWHTPWNGTPFSFPVTFTITLKETTHVDYIRYIPRQDGNSNGNWNVVYVAYCPTTNGSNFTNLGQYALNGAGLTYDFMLTDAGLECGQIKFTIESGNANHASAGEIEAYAIDYSKQEEYAQYFTDDLFTELKADVTNSEGIEDAEIKALVDNLLTDAEGYKKFRVGEYEPYMTTRTLQSILKSSSQYNNYENPTGIYLKAGETCAVMVSGIENDPVGLKIKNWYLSEASSSYSLRNGLNFITATTEGNVFVNYYTDNFENAPNVKVHFINAPVQGYWDQATMTNEDWVEMLKGRSKDDHTILITRSEHAQLAYPVSSWLEHCPDNVDSTMTLYQQVQWAERDIIGLERYGRQAKNRQLYYATDYGFMAAGGDGAYCNVTSLGAIMAPDAKVFDFWGVGHEWGHNNQVTPGFKWSGCGETTNNIKASWAQFHFTAHRNPDGTPSYLRLEDEWSGIGEYSGMRGGRMQTYFEEGIRKGVAWQLQDGPDYHGTVPAEKTVDGQDANGNNIGTVTTTSRNYDHFVKLVPFWQLNLWGTVAGKCPDIIPMVIESIRTTENYGSIYNTNGKQQINWMKIACDSAQIDLLPFFEKAGMLRPIHAYIEDYGAGWNIITEEMIAKLKAHVGEKGYPAFTEEINYINGHNYHIYRDCLKLEVPSTIGNGCTVNGNKITVQHSAIKNAVAFETYNAYGELLRITMYGLGSNDTHSFTQVLYPKGNDLSTNSAYIMAVGYDGTRKRVYEEENIDEIFKNELSSLLEQVNVYLTRTDTTGTKIGFLLPDHIIEFAALVHETDELMANTTPAEADYEGWYIQLKAALASLMANSATCVPLAPHCYYSLAVSGNGRYMDNANAGLKTSIAEEGVAPQQWKLIPADEQDTYYIQHRETGNYITTVANNQRVKATSNDRTMAVAFRLVPDAPGEFYIQRADNANINLYNYKTNNQVYAAKDTTADAKWLITLEDDMMSLPETSTDEELVIYGLLRADSEKYAGYTDSRTSKGRLYNSAYNERKETNFWFYFIEGSEEGKYAVYNYATRMPVTANGSNLWTNKEAETAPEYVIARNAEGTGLVISAPEGCWYMDPINNLGVLSTTDTTLWKLQLLRTISLTDEPLTSLTIDRATATLTEGETLTLTVATAPSYATDHSVTWSSSDEAVATVDTNGKVDAIAAGTATITATANDKSGLTATCQVTVKKKVEDGIDNATGTALTVQSKAGVITLSGLAKSTTVSVYDITGRTVATSTATDGTATIDTRLTEGSTVIVRAGDKCMKVSL